MVFAVESVPEIARAYNLSPKEFILFNRTLLICTDTKPAGEKIAAIKEALNDPRVSMALCHWCFEMWASPAILPEELAEELARDPVEVSETKTRT